MRDHAESSAGRDLIAGEPQSVETPRRVEHDVVLALWFLEDLAARLNQSLEAAQPGCAWIRHIEVRARTGDCEQKGEACSDAAGADDEDPVVRPYCRPRGRVLRAGQRLAQCQSSRERC